MCCRGGEQPLDVSPRRRSEKSSSSEVSNMNLLLCSPFLSRSPSLPSRSLSEPQTIKHPSTLSLRCTNTSVHPVPGELPSSPDPPEWTWEGSSLLLSHLRTAFLTLYLPSSWAADTGSSTRRGLFQLLRRSWTAGREDDEEHMSVGRTTAAVTHLSGKFNVFFFYSLIHLIFSFLVKFLRWMFAREAYGGMQRDKWVWGRTNKTRAQCERNHLSPTWFCGFRLISLVLVELNAAFKYFPPVWWQPSPAQTTRSAH